MLSARLPWSTEQAPQLPALGGGGAEQELPHLPTHSWGVGLGVGAGKMVVAAGGAKDAGRGPCQSSAQHDKTKVRQKPKDSV